MGKATPDGTYKAVGPGATIGTVEVDLPPVAPLDLGSLCIEIREASNVQVALVKDVNARLDKLCAALCAAIERPAPIVNLPPLVPEIRVVSPPPAPPQITVQPSEVVVETGDEAPSQWPIILLLILVAAHLALAALPLLGGLW